MRREDEALDARGWVEQQVEKYLSEVKLHLLAAPAPRREQALGEMGEHLRAMVAARRMDGLGEREAWRQAAEAFGTPREVGEALEAAWRRSSRVEVEGEPLSHAEKRAMWKLPSAMVAAHALALAVASQLLSHRLATVVVALVAVGQIVGLLKKWRRGEGPTVAAARCQEAVTALLWVWIALSMQPRIDLSRVAHFEQRMQAAIMLALLVGAWWLKSNRSTRPWQSLPRYAHSPIAAEQEHRLGRRLSLATGTAVICDNALFVVWSAYGLAPALAACAGVIALAVLVAQLLK